MSSVNTTISQLNQATSMIVLVFSVISIVPGGIGLIFNVLVFTRPSLRREPCAIYFFWSTCFSLITIFIIQPLRLIAVSFNLDTANYNIGICKTQFLTLYVTRSISVWLIVFACIDRFFHSSADAHIRRMSSIKTTRMAIVLTSVVLFLGHIHMIIYYDLNNGLDRFGKITPLCTAQKGVYATFVPLWNIVLYSLCPSLLMLSFGLLTLKNLRQQRTAITVTTGLNRISTRRKDIQLLRMLTAQVLVIMIFTLPVSIYQLYLSFSSYTVKDTLRVARENVAYRTLGIIPYFAHSSTFYLYTLTGTVFRKEFFKILKACFRCNQNHVAPTTVEERHMPVLKKSQRTNTRDTGAT